MGDDQDADKPDHQRRYLALVWATILDQWLTPHQKDLKWGIVESDRLSDRRA
jgi:hypothetical protein